MVLPQEDDDGARYSVVDLGLRDSGGRSGDSYGSGRAGATGPAPAAGTATSVGTVGAAGASGPRQEPRIDDAAGAIGTPPAGPPSGRRSRRRAAAVAVAVLAVLVVAANLTPRDPGAAPERGVRAQDRPLAVCEAVAFANQTGGLPSKPAVLPQRATGYFSFTDAGSRSAVASGLFYRDGSVSLCRPVSDPGKGEPQPEQPELPALSDNRTYAYEMRGGELTLVGERAADGTITRREE